MAAERGTVQDFWLMEDILTQIDRQIQRQESVAAPAAEFHLAVAKATHNDVLAKLVRSFTHLMTKAGLLLESRCGSDPVFKLNELASHRELYTVIKQGDPEAARRAMFAHIAALESRSSKCSKTPVAHRVRTHRRPHSTRE